VSEESQVTGPIVQSVGVNVKYNNIPVRQRNYYAYQRTKRTSTKIRRVPKNKTEKGRRSE
jgi:hypothetical protein